MKDFQITPVPNKASGLLLAWQIDILGIHYRMALYMQTRKNAK
jgi:hypothetical protein